MDKGFRIKIKGVIYKMPLKEAKYVMYNMHMAKSAPNVSDSMKDYVIKEHVNKKVLEGDYVILKEGEMPDLKMYVFESTSDIFKFNIMHPSNIWTQILIGFVFASLLFGLTSGRLFGLLLGVFGVIILLFKGIVLGRDLEKEYKE